MEVKIMSKYNFTINIDDVTYSNDVFLEKFRNLLNEYDINTYKSKEKTGHANTVGVGVGMIGPGIGGGTTDIIFHSWNPFDIKVPANKFSFFGSFKGFLKVSELSHYMTKIKKKNINFKNFEIYGELDYKQNVGVTFGVCFIFTLIFSFLVNVLGVFIGLIFGIVYHNVIKSYAMKEIDYPVKLIENSVNDYQKEIKDYTKSIK